MFFWIIPDEDRPGPGLDLSVGFGIAELSWFGVGVDVLFRMRALTEMALSSPEIGGSSILTSGARARCEGSMVLVGFVSLISLLSPSISLPLFTPLVCGSIVEPLCKFRIAICRTVDTDFGEVRSGAGGATSPATSSSESGITSGESERLLIFFRVAGELTFGGEKLRNLTRVDPFSVMLGAACGSTPSRTRFVGRVSGIDWTDRLRGLFLGETTGEGVSRILEFGNFSAACWGLWDFFPIIETLKTLNSKKAI